MISSDNKMLVASRLDPNEIANIIDNWSHQFNCPNNFTYSYGKQHTAIKEFQKKLEVVEPRKNSDEEENDASYVMKKKYRQRH
jgi:hypothetical protein